MAFLRTNDVNFYHPVDDNTENTQSQVWAGSGLFVAAALPPSNPSGLAPDTGSNISALSEQTYVGSSGTFRVIGVKLTDTKHVSVYFREEGTDIDLYCKVLEYSDGIATSGDEFTITTGTAYTNYPKCTAAHRMNDDQLIVTRLDGTGGTYADIIQVSGLTASLGSATKYNTAYMSRLDMAEMVPYVSGVSSGVYMVTGRSFTDNKCYVQAITASGTTIDSGSPIAIYGTIHTDGLAVASFNDEEFLTFFTPTGDIGGYRYGSISGLTTTLGTSGVVWDDKLVECPVAHKLDTDRIVMQAKLSGENDRLFQYYLVDGAVSGTPSGGISIQHSDRKDIAIMDNGHVASYTSVTSSEEATARIISLTETSGTLGPNYITDWKDDSSLVPLNGNDFVVYSNASGTDHGSLQVYTASGISHIYASNQGAYPLASGAIRLSLAFWTQKPTILASKWYIDAGYNVGLASGSVVFGDSDATWNDVAIVNLMSDINNDSEHFVVLDFSSSGSNNWGLLTSIDGSGWVDQGLQNSGSGSVLSSDGSKPSIMASGTNNHNSWLDEVIVWCGDSAQFTSGELNNLYTLGNTHADTMDNYSLYFVDSTTSTCPLVMEGWEPTPHSGDISMIIPGHQSYISETEKLYFSDRDTDNIRRCNLDGSEIEVLVSGLPKPRDLTIDEVNGKIYWLDSEADIIQRADMDGGNLETVVSGLDNPCGIAFDADNEYLYWTDSATRKVQRSKYDGTEVTDLITSNISGVQGICLDVASGHLYFVDNIYDTIFRADIDGSNLTEIVNTDLDLPVGLELDLPNRKMYWTDFGNDTIKRANMDGTSIETLIPSGTLHTPHGLTLDLVREHMYWVDLGTDKLQRANLDGSNVQDIITAGLQYPDGIELGIYDNVNVNLYTPAHDAAAVSGNLYIAGQTAYSEINLYMFGNESVAWTYQGRSAEEFVKTADYSPQLIGNISGSPTTVTIQVWNVTSQVNTELSLTSSGCYAIGGTGRWGWSTSNLPVMHTERQHFFYRMVSDLGDVYDGEFRITTPEGIKWLHPRSRSDFLV